MARRDRLYVRATTDDLERWRARADAAGVSLSVYARARLDGRPLPARSRTQTVAGATARTDEQPDWQATLDRIAAGLPG